MEGGGLHCFKRCTHPYIENALENKYFIFIYGPSATGKTHLSYHIAECSGSRGLKPVILATEPGTTLYAQHTPVKVPVETVLSIDELALRTLGLVAKGHYIIVDSLNYLYRLNPSIEYARFLAFTSALLRKSGGMATGQVSLDGRPSGFNYIAPYANIIGYTEKTSPSRFKLTIIKPEKKILAFRVKQGALEWI